VLYNDKIECYFLDFLKTSVLKKNYIMCGRGSLVVTIVVQLDDFYEAFKPIITLLYKEELLI